MRTIAWTVTSRLAIAASWLPRPLYFRLLAYVLQPLLRLARGDAARPQVRKEERAPQPAPVAPAAVDPARAICAVAPSMPMRVVARALVIDGFAPTPDKDAASVDICWFMRILMSLGYEVTFVPAFSPAHAGRYTDDLRRLGIVCPVAPELGSARDFIAAQGATFDLMAVYRITVADPLVDTIRKSAPRAKIVFNTVDLHFLRDQRQAEVNGELNAFVDARRRERRELAVIRTVDAAVLLSEYEYDYVGRHAPGARRFFIPLATPVPGRLAPFEARNGVLFVGGFAHAPNIDAVHYLCSEIWPRVREALPDARLFIAGASPPPGIEAYHSRGDGIDVPGHVPDLTDLYRSVRVSVAPLRFGAGLKGKVVASLAVGLPCVVTSIAAEGMPKGGAEGVAVADEADDFARAVVEIHADATRWNVMSDAGVAYARANFSIDATTKRIRSMLDSLGVPNQIENPSALN